MLVITRQKDEITRQKDESIMIGDDIEISIVDIRGDKVRLGVSAPRSISIHRKEIYEAIQEEKRKNENRRRQAELAKKAQEKKTK